MVEEKIYEKYNNDKEKIKEAQSGNTEAIENLINHNKGLLWSIVKRFIKCIKNFDTNFDVKLSTYAVPYILGEMKRYIQDDGPIKVSRTLKELHVKILYAQKEHMKKTGNDISIEELEKELKVSKEDIIMALDSQNPVSSIDEYTNNQEEGQTLLDKLANNIDEANMVTNKITIMQLINSLKTREKQIILLRYYKGKTQTEIAKILGITQVQISRIEKKILNDMKRNLTENILTG